MVIEKDNGTQHRDINDDFFNVSDVVRDCVK